MLVYYASRGLSDIPPRPAALCFFFFAFSILRHLSFRSTCSSAGRVVEPICPKNEGARSRFLPLHPPC